MNSFPQNRQVALQCIHLFDPGKASFEEILPPRICRSRLRARREMGRDVVPSRRAQSRERHKRDITGGMDDPSMNRRWLIVASVLWIGLVASTMLPPSQAALERAAPYFSATEIEDGLRYSSQRRWLMWAGQTVELGLLIV